MVALDRTAVLPAGRVVKDHRKVSGRDWMSVALPFNCTVAPWSTVWGLPATAVGAGMALVVMVTVLAALLTIPSLTINCAT